MATGAGLNVGLAPLQKRTEQSWCRDGSTLALNPFQTADDTHMGISELTVVVAALDLPVTGHAAVEAYPARGLAQTGFERFNTVGSRNNQTQNIGLSTRHQYSESVSMTTMQIQD